MEPFDWLNHSTWISQVNNEFAILAMIFHKSYESWGGGMSLEKDFENSLYTFSTMTNIANANYFLKLIVYIFRKTKFNFFRIS